MNANPDLYPSQLAQRELTDADLEQVLALHMRCTEHLGPDLVRHETLESLRQLLQRGRFLGMFEQQELVAYGVLLQELQVHEKLPIRIAPDTQRPQAMLAGMAVAPHWRGQGLQRRLIMQRMALVPTHTLVFSTAAPANWYSWNNLLDCGFHVRDITAQYGEHIRYLLVQEPLPTHALYPDLSKEFHALDLQRQLRLLELGWRGAQPGHRPEYLRYVPTLRDSE